MGAFSWLFATVAVMPLVSYGLLNVLRPSVTTRWQIRATARAGASDPRKLVGEGFARWMGVTASSDPEHDPAVLRRIRWLGVAELVGAVPLLVGMALMLR